MSDFEPDHMRAVRQVLERCEGWLERISRHGHYIEGRMMQEGIFGL